MGIYLVAAKRGRESFQDLGNDFESQFFETQYTYRFCSKRLPTPSSFRRE